MTRTHTATPGVAAKRKVRALGGSSGFLVMTGLLSALFTMPAVASEGWQSTTGMGVGGYAPTATVLRGPTNEGKVLVVGGFTGETPTADPPDPLRPARKCVSIAQLFDPTTSTWSPAFDPETGTWSPAAPTRLLKTSRSFHTAADFGDDSGRVFIAGGFTTNSYYQWVTQRSTEVYDPVTDTFDYAKRTETRLVKKGGKWVQQTSTVQVSMNTPRELFTATLLPKQQGSVGKILLVGGMYGGRNIVRTAELFDPATMTITYTKGSMQTSYGRFEHDAVFMPPAASDVDTDRGTVLVVGGKDRNPYTGVWTTLGTAELYDVYAETFESIPMLNARARPRVVWIETVPRLSDPTRQGMALVVGGKYEGPDGWRDVLECEWFDPSDKRFYPGPSLQAGRMAHTLTPLGNDGSFLVAGGWSHTLGQSTASAERFVLDPTSPVRGAFVSLTYMADERQDHDAVALGDGRVLVVGGKPNKGGADRYLNNESETYTPY